MTSMFSPEQFLSTEVNVGRLDTRRPIVPAGDYNAVIKEVKQPRAVETQNGQQYVLPIVVNISHPDHESTVGSATSILTKDLWLDLSPEGGLASGPGKNVDLGKLLEAIGLNGKSWKPGDFVGQSLLARVGTRVNKKTGEEINEIKDITSA